MAGVSEISSGELTLFQRAVLSESPPRPTNTPKLLTREQFCSRYPPTFSVVTPFEDRSMSTRCFPYSLPGESGIRAATVAQDPIE